VGADVLSLAAWGFRHGILCNEGTLAAFRMYATSFAADAEAAEREHGVPATRRRPFARPPLIKVTKTAVRFSALSRNGPHDCGGDQRSFRAARRELGSDTVTVTKAATLDGIMAEVAAAKLVVTSRCLDLVEFTQIAEVRRRKPLMQS
jgi:hypothetical protein